MPFTTALFDSGFHQPAGRQDIVVDPGVAPRDAQPRPFLVVSHPFGRLTAPGIISPLTLPLEQHAS
jgi:hypothetical protein